MCYELSLWYVLHTHSVDADTVNKSLKHLLMVCQKSPTHSLPRESYIEVYIVSSSVNKKKKRKTTPFSMHDGTLWYLLY